MTIEEILNRKKEPRKKETLTTWQLALVMLCCITFLYDAWFMGSWLFNLQAGHHSCIMLTGSRSTSFLLKYLLSFGGNASFSNTVQIFWVWKILKLRYSFMCCLMLNIYPLWNFPERFTTFRLFFCNNLCY